MVQLRGQKKSIQKSGNRITAKSLNGENMSYEVMMGDKVVAVYEDDELNISDYERVPIFLKNTGDFFII